MASPVPRDHGEAVPEKKIYFLVRSPGCPFGPVARLPGWPLCPVARLAAARLRPFAFHYPVLAIKFRRPQRIEPTAGAPKNRSNLPLGSQMPPPLGSLGTATGSLRSHGL